MSVRCGCGDDHEPWQHDRTRHPARNHDCLGEGINGATPARDALREAIVKGINNEATRGGDLAHEWEPGGIEPHTDRTGGWLNGWLDALDSVMRFLATPDPAPDDYTRGYERGYQEASAAALATPDPAPDVCGSWGQCTYSAGHGGVHSFLSDAIPDPAPTYAERLREAHPDKWWTAAPPSAPDAVICNADCNACRHYAIEEGIPFVVPDPAPRGCAVHPGLDAPGCHGCWMANHHVHDARYIGCAGCIALASREAR